MQMQDLTKTQIVLLALLVSFVSSLATGIVTVTLMDQSPQEVTRVLNRVVQKTVNQIVPAPVESPAKKPVEHTVVVKEEDLITTALSKNSKTLVRLYEIPDPSLVAKAEKRFVGLAFIVDPDGTVVTDSSLIDSEHTYAGVLFDGSQKLFSIVQYDPKEKSALLQFVRVAEDILASESGAQSFPSVTFADSAQFKIGQSVLMLIGNVRDEAEMGILSSLQYKDGIAAAGDALRGISGLATNIRTDGATGAPLLNILGEVMAVTVIGATNNPAYIPASIVKEQLSTFHKEGIAVRRNVSVPETKSEVTPDVLQP